MPTIEDVLQRYPYVQRLLVDCGRWYGCDGRYQRPAHREAPGVG